MHGEPAFNRPERTNCPFPLQMVRTIGCLTDVEFLFDSGANTRAMQDSSLLSHSTKAYIGQVHAVGGSGLGSDPGDLLLSFGDSSDVLLVPSLAEGMPTVVLEAKARGLCVIATDVGALPELEDTLLEPGDVDALAMAMMNSRKDSMSLALSPEFRWNRIAELTLVKLTEE